MKVAFVNYHYDENIDLDEYFGRFPAVHGWSKSLSESGLEVCVYHRFNEDHSFLRDGVQYFLIKDGRNARLRWYENPAEFHRKICKEDHDIIHINSFVYSRQAALLQKKSGKAKIVIQHHAEKYGSGIKRFLLRRFTSGIDGFIFSSKEIYDDWLEKEAIRAGKKFSEIMEGSSGFNFRDRDEMRRKTGLSGNPVFLWVGRLNSNKDPLTVISGFSKLLHEYPDAKLYMIYSEEDLLPEVDSFINQDSSLIKSVKPVGYVKYDEISDFYNSADYFVLGSHYEGSGFSLVEAMSCGAIPIVTDIPSFRMMTNYGQVGGLWKCGDAESFYLAVRKVMSRSLRSESEKTAEIFNQNLSYTSISKKAKAFYESLINKD